MPQGAQTPSVIRFEDYELDLAAGELRKQGFALKLQPQPFKILAYLASRPGELVTRNELRNHVWSPGTFVDFDQGINQAIKQIRAVLNDDADSPRVIAALPRRGYRFIAKTTPAAKSDGSLTQVPREGQEEVPFVAEKNLKRETRFPAQERTVEKAHAGASTLLWWFYVPIAMAFAVILLILLRAVIFTLPPAPYQTQRWAWAGSGLPDRIAWKLPAPWEITPFGDRPALIVNGPQWEAGWPHEFDDAVLRNFIFRFGVLFPDADQSDGTKLIWLIRSREHGPGYEIARWYKPEMEAITGYQFRLIKQRRDLYVSGRVVRRGLSRPAMLDGKPLKLGLHCCRNTTEYQIVVRVYEDHLDNCLTPISRTNLRTGAPDDPDAGHVGAAYFRDSTFSWGSIGFASGDAAKRVILRDIEVISLDPKFRSTLPSDPLQEYFSKTFVCH